LEGERQKPAPLEIILYRREHVADLHQPDDNLCRVAADRQLRQLKEDFISNVSHELKTPFR